MAVVADVGNDKGKARELTAVDVGDEWPGSGSAQRHIIGQAGGMIAAADVVRGGVVLHSVRRLRHGCTVGRHALDIASFRPTCHPDLPEEVVGGDRVRRRTGIVGDAIGLSGRRAKVVRKRRGSDLVVGAVGAALPGHRCFVGGSGIAENVGVGSVLHPDPDDVGVLGRGGCLEPTGRSGNAWPGCRGGRWCHRRRRRRSGRSGRRRGGARRRGDRRLQGCDRRRRDGSRCHRRSMTRARR